MELSLESKYVTEDGTILISGVQALVRLPMDQHRADRRAGLRTATLVSGYRGSPLGGLDHELQRRERLLRDHEIRFLPGIRVRFERRVRFHPFITLLGVRARENRLVGVDPWRIA